MTDEQLVKVFGLMVEKLSDIGQAINSGNNAILSAIQDNKETNVVEFSKSKESVNEVREEEDVEDFILSLRNKINQPFKKPENVEIVDNVPSSHYEPKHSKRPNRLSVSDHSEDTMGFGPMSLGKNIINY